MAPANTITVTYCDSTDLSDWMSSDGLTLHLDDDGDGSTTTTEDGRVTKAIQYATTEVNRFCLGRYAAEELAVSWSVNTWATALAVRWLYMRRGNPIPKSLADFIRNEVYPTLQGVKSGEQSIQQDDVEARVLSAPAWSNGRYDARYPLRKWRVERPISEGTRPDVGRQNLDRGAEASQDTY